MQNVMVSAKKNISMGLFIVFSLLLYILSGFTHTAHAEERWVDKSSQFNIKLLNPIRSRRFTYALSPVELTNLGETLTGKHRLVISSLWPENIIIEGAELDQEGSLFLPFNGEIISGRTTKVTLKFLDAVRQSFGYEVQVQQLDTSIALPPDPADIAPALNPTKVVNLKEAVEFLFTGDNPIQTGVNADDIVAKRVAVVRGQVLNKDNTPLSGVTITIKNHTEYGQTLSRIDGWFDIAVNGGGYVTVNYTKDGYLPVQRRINTPWRDFVISEDVVMLSLDPQVTTIDLTSTQDMQVAQGSVQTDADGDRQVTMFFPRGTSATMVMPNGSTQSLSTLNVRATEYTVGENGRNAMPGELPPFSGYTYAVELSVDEAISAGATRVDFNQEIPVYVENFLEFPTGEIVPLGWYDHNLSAWIPSKNGRIVEILSITNGLADLDVEGNGDIAEQVALDELDIGEEELRQLASTFTIGKVLWRMPITHFTPWDGNWPYGPPEDAEPPLNEEPETPDDEEPDEEEEDECDGCIIKAQSQTLGESISVVGSGLSLNYRSDRVKGNNKKNVVKIPVTGDSVPETLLSIKVTVSILGQKHVYNLLPSPNLVIGFTWDGLNAFGQPFSSGLAKITIAYDYPPTYYPTTVDFINSFGRIRGQGQSIGFRGDGQRTLSLDRVWSKMLFAPGDLGNTITAVNALGAWSVSNMHVYNVNAKELLLGTGGKATTKRINNYVLYDEVGNGISGNSGDGGLALKAELNEPTSITVSSSGIVYFVEGTGYSNLIKKVGLDGVITTIAGNGETGFSGDGGAATEATLNMYLTSRITAVGNTEIEPPNPRVAPLLNIQLAKNSNLLVTETELFYPTDVKVAADGTLYIVESNSYRIRTINPQGQVATVAGNGIKGYSTDGTIATEASLGSVGDILLLDDGTFYFTETYNNLIRYVGVDGTLTTVAGGGDELEFNGILAKDSKLSNPTSLDIDKEGNIYFVNRYRKIYQIAQDGIIRLLAGSSESGYNGSAILSIGAKFDFISDIEIDADKNIHVVDHFNNRVRKVTEVFPSYSEQNEIIIPSSSGDQLFYFNPDGHHLKTVDTISGVDLFTFTYTDKGQLNSISDVNNRITVIERDSIGVATAIISPDGQATTLNFDSNGYLSSIANPENNADNFTYTDDGLMLTYTNARGFTNNYSYDALGLFVQDVEPTGGGWQIERDNKDDGYFVKMTSAEGRTHQFEVKNLATGELQKRNITPDGIATEILFANEGIQKTIYANGNIMQTQNGTDPRFGMLVPSLKFSTLTTPSGLVNNMTASKSVVLESDDDLLSHSSLTNTTTINGNTQTSQYITATKTWTSTSPEGRISTNVLDDKGRSIETEVNNLAPTNFAYNTEGRFAYISQGSGIDSRETSLAYYSSGAQQGFLQSITDAANRETSFSYDNAGRLLTQTLPNGNEINFNYDANGNITSITPANEKTHAFNFTEVDKTSDYTPPDVAEITQASTQYSYNLDKQLELITLPNGQEVDYVYHATKGYKIQTIIPRGNYDYAYNATTGQIEQVTAPDGGKIAFTYDGSLVLSAQLTGAVSGKVNQVYNNDFKVTQRCVNIGDCIDFSYDNDLLLTQAGSLTIIRAAQKGGLITGTSVGNISTSNTYNDFGEPLSISTNNSDVYSVDYTRDNLGRITQKVETIQGVTTTFGYTYDLLGQLSSVTTNGVITSSYSFDDNGNRTHVNGIAIANVDAQDRLKQHLTDSGNNQYIYSDNGDLVSKTNTTTNKVSLYHYDVLGNLISAAIPDDNSIATTQIEYIIDAQNRRVGKKVNDTLTQGFLYKDQLNPIAELDGNGTIVSRFVYGSKAFVPDYMVKDGKTYRILSDHLGSPRLVINTSDSTVVQRLDYDIWGNITLDTNPGFQPFGFAGGLYDQNTKFTRFGARDYDAEIGR